MKERMFLIISEGNHMTYGKVIDGEYLELQETGDINLQSGQPIMDYLPLLEECDCEACSGFDEYRNTFKDIVDTEYNYLIIELLDEYKSKIIKTFNEKTFEIYYCDEFKNLRE